MPKLTFRRSVGRRSFLLGSAALSGGSYSFLDRSPAEPQLYRAVYVDPRSGIPFAALLHPYAN